VAWLFKGLTFCLLITSPPRFSSFLTPGVFPRVEFAFFFFEDPGISSEPGVSTPSPRPPWVFRFPLVSTFFFFFLEVGALSHGPISKFVLSRGHGPPLLHSEFRSLELLFRMPGSVSLHEAGFSPGAWKLMFPLDNRWTLGFFFFFF